MHGDPIVSSLLEALVHGQLDAQIGMEAIEIAGIDSAVHKGVLLDWILPLTDDSDKSSIAGVFVVP